MTILPQAPRHQPPPLVAPLALRSAAALGSARARVWSPAARRGAAAPGRDPVEGRLAGWGKMWEEKLLMNHVRKVNGIFHYNGVMG